jgi:hypothetical protein
VAGAIAATLLVRRDPAGLAFVLALFGLLLVMSTWAAPLWKLPGMSTIQFPWRLLLIASFCAALAGGSFLDALEKLDARVACHAALLLAGGLVVLSAPKIGVAGYFPNQAYIYQPEVTRRKFISTNIEEVDPIWVRQRPAPGSEEGVSQRRILSATGEVLRVISPEEVTDARFSAALASGGPLRYEEVDGRQRHHRGQAQVLGQQHGQRRDAGHHVVGDLVLDGRVGMSRIPVIAGFLVIPAGMVAEAFEPDEPYGRVQVIDSHSELDAEHFAARAAGDRRVTQVDVIVHVDVPVLTELLQWHVPGRLDFADAETDKHKDTYMSFR